MSTGSVDWYDPRRGYGLLTSDVGRKKVLIEESELAKIGVTSLPVGQRIEYEAEEQRGKHRAIDVRLIPGN